MSRKVFIRGNFAEGNFGDDCLLAANVLLLRKAHFEPAMLGPQSISAEADFVVPTARLKDAARGGLVLYGGGTQFFFDPGMAFELGAPPLAARLRRLVSDPAQVVSSLHARVIQALINRLPIASIGLGVGPFGSEAAADEANVKALLSKMTFVWVRDSASERFCALNGITCSTSTDLCFTKPFLARFAAKTTSNFDGSQPSIGVILSDHPTLDQAFLTKIIDASNAMRGAGCRVRYISFSRRRDRFIEVLQARGEPVTCWNPATMKIDTFRAFLAEHDAILTSRFHGGVFSVINRTPFAIIGVNEKLRSLAQRYSKAGIAVLSPTSTADEFTSAALMMLEQQSDQRAALKDALASEIELAADGEAAFARHLASTR